MTIRTTVYRGWVRVHDHVAVGEPDIGRVADFVEVEFRFHDVGLSEQVSLRRHPEQVPVILFYDQPKSSPHRTMRIAISRQAC